MKIILLYSFLASGTFLSAQEIYIHPTTGYGVGFPGITGTSTELKGSEYKVALERLGLGGGLNAGVSFGLVNDNNWGFDLNLQYQNFFGKEITDVFYLDGSESKSKYSSWSIRFTPSLRIQADNDEVNPYVLFGPTFNYMRMTDSYQSEDDMIVRETVGRVSFGGAVTAGIDFEVDNNLYLTTAIQVHLGYFKPKKSVVTKAESKGVDLLPQMDTYTKETVYVDELTYNSNINYDEPSKELAAHGDYSSVNLMIGVRFILN